MSDKDRIIELWRKVNRPGVNALIGYLEESDFFTAPSSRDHHLAKVGGLAEHSLNVFDMLVEKCNRFSQLPCMPFFPSESIVICGLGH